MRIKSILLHSAVHDCGQERPASAWQGTHRWQMLLCTALDRKQLPMANRRRTPDLASSKHLGATSMLHVMPMTEPKGNVRSNFTVSE